MRIEVHIERLVLDGLPVSPHDANAIRSAVEGELAMLLADGGVARDLASGGAVPNRNAPLLRLGGAAEPAALGRSIARSVHGGIGR